MATTGITAPPEEDAEMLDRRINEDIASTAVPGRERLAATGITDTPAPLI